MRFVVANTLEDTFDELRRQWWGKPKSLHVDCWAEIEAVDGYRVTLTPEPFAGAQRLYYNPLAFTCKYYPIRQSAQSMP